LEFFLEGLALVLRGRCCCGDGDVALEGAMTVHDDVRVADADAAVRRIPAVHNDRLAGQANIVLGWVDRWWLGRR
jgi:hypothetical protein